MSDIKKQLKSIQKDMKIIKKDLKSKNLDSAKEHSNDLLKRIKELRKNQDLTGSQVKKLDQGEEAIQFFLGVLKQQEEMKKKWN